MSHCFHLALRLPWLHGKGGTKFCSFQRPGLREQKVGGMFIHFDANTRGKCNGCGSQGTILHLLLTRTNGGLDLCVDCFGALAQACRLAARKLRLHDPLAF